MSSTAEATVTVRAMMTDRHGLVAVVPDDVARRLRVAIRKGWREFPGIAHGTSREFAPGSWEYEATMAVLRAVCALPEFAADEVPPGFGPVVFVVGTSGWDDELGDWRDYDGTRDVRVPGFPGVEYGSGPGARPVTWQG